MSRHSDDFEESPDPEGAQKPDPAKLVHWSARNAATTPDRDPSAGRMNPTEISAEAESIGASDSAQGYAREKRTASQRAF
jgi:hypothetical protein